MTRITTRTRFVAVAALLAVALTIATASAVGATTTANRTASDSRSPHSPCQPPTGIQSSITGIVQNETNEPIRLFRAEHGLTNAWCVRPTDVPAHGSSAFEVVDGFFKSHVSLIYAFPGDASARFTATIVFAFPIDTIDIGCIVKGKTTHRCEAIVTESRGNNRNIKVLFRIFPAS